MPAKLNFPEFEFRLKEEDHKKMIFDPIRKKFVSLTPEEWVRQHAIRYLTDNKGYPAGLLGIETSLRFQGMNRRCDILVFRNNVPFLLAELKAPEVPVSLKTIEQIGRYQSVVGARFFWLSNGIQHVFLELVRGNKITAAADIPHWNDPT